MASPLVWVIVELFVGVVLVDAELVGVELVGVLLVGVLLVGAVFDVLIKVSELVTAGGLEAVQEDKCVCVVVVGTLLTNVGDEATGVDVTGADVTGAVVTGVEATGAEVTGAVVVDGVVAVVLTVVLPKSVERKPPYRILRMVSIRVILAQFRKLPLQLPLQYLLLVVALGSNWLVPVL